MGVATKISGYSHMWTPMGMASNTFAQPLGLGRNGRMELYFVIKMLRTHFIMFGLFQNMNKKRLNKVDKDFSLLDLINLKF